MTRYTNARIRFAMHGILFWILAIIGCGAFEGKKPMCVVFLSLGLAIWNLKLGYEAYVVLEEEEHGRHK